MNSVLLKFLGKLLVAFLAVVGLACNPHDAANKAERSAVSMSLDSIIPLFVEAAMPYSYGRENAVAISAETNADRISLVLEYRPPFGSPRPSRTSKISGHCVYCYFEPPLAWLFASIAEDACEVLTVEPNAMMDWYSWELVLGSDSTFHLVPPAPANFP